MRQSNSLNIYVIRISYLNTLRPVSYTHLFSKATITHLRFATKKWIKSFEWSNKIHLAITLSCLMLGYFSRILFFQLCYMLHSMYNYPLLCIIIHLYLEKACTLSWKYCKKFITMIEYKYLVFISYTDKDVYKRQRWMLLMPVLNFLTRNSLKSIKVVFPNLHTCTVILFL